MIVNILNHSNTQKKFIPNFCQITPTSYLNPIQSGGGGGFKSNMRSTARYNTPLALKSPPPPPQMFCLHVFNIGATLLCVGDFSKKIV